MSKANVTRVERDPDAAEIARLRKLYSLGLMDTPNEVEFDELTQLAAVVCGTPQSMMTLVDGHRQWFKSKVGTEVSETPIDVSFCRHAIGNPGELFVVEDTLKDERFAENALVTGNPGIRFYAGMPLHISDEHAVGTLCVIDTVPRRLTPDQENALRVLARQVRARIELRLQRDALQKALEEREEALSQLRAGEALFRAFMNASPFLSFIKDVEFRYVFYNKKFADHFNISMDWLLGKCDAEILPSILVKEILAADQITLVEGEVFELESTSPGVDGTLEHWRSFRFRCFDAEGRAMLGGIAQNVTIERERGHAIKLYQQQLEAANKMLKQLAVTDALTGLSNRRAFEERLELDFSVARRRRRSLTLVMLDLDNFKMRNDLHGHAAGDQVLRDLAVILNASTRLTDHAARYGGEEFGVLLPETDTPAAWLWAERFQQSMRDYPWEGEPATVSIGLATINGTIGNGAELVVLADAALYEAKRTGKNHAVHYGGAESLAEEDLLGTA